MSHGFMRFARIRVIKLRSALASVRYLKSSGLVGFSFLVTRNLSPCFWLSEIMPSIYIWFAVSMSLSFIVSHIFYSIPDRPAR